MPTTKVSEKIKNVKSSQKIKEIPDYLVYEILDDKKIYYRNYKKVLSGELPAEAVRSSTILMSWIISAIGKLLALNINTKKYKVLLSGVGYYYKADNWLILDLAIMNREKYKKPLGTYLKVPPDVVIEVDTKADLSEIGSEYFMIKTDRLLKSGVKKVIWIFTDVKKIQIAENNKPWLIVNFDYEFEIIDGIKMNLEKLLKEEEED
jgi:hypothetical protein